MCVLRYVSMFVFRVCCVSVLLLSFLCMYVCSCVCVSVFGLCCH